MNDWWINESMKHMHPHISKMTTNDIFIKWQINNNIHITQSIDKSVNHTITYINASMNHIAIDNSQLKLIIKDKYQYHHSCLHQIHSSLHISSSAFQYHQWSVITSSLHKITAQLIQVHKIITHQSSLHKITAGQWSLPDLHVRPSRFQHALVYLRIAAIQH